MVFPTFKIRMVESRATTGHLNFDFFRIVEPNGSLA